MSKSDYGDSFLKLDTDLNLSDYFTPADWDYRWDHACAPSGNDLDLGSAGEMLVPDGVLQDSHYKNIVIKGEKESNLWVIDRTHPGGTGTGCSANCQPCTGTNNVLQRFPISGTKQSRSTPAFWNDGTTPFMYFAQAYTPLNQYKLNCAYPNGPICSPASATTSVDIGYSATPSVSSHGTTSGTGIVWVINAVGGNALFAFDAETLATLYSSNTCLNRDGIGPPTKFSVPTIANGYVFVGTQTDFDIFGTTTASCN